MYRSFRLRGEGKNYYEIEKKVPDRFILAQKGQQERGERQVSMSELALARTQQENKKREGMATELADLVEGNDKILKSVAEGKTTPQQIKETSELQEKQRQQERACKQEQQRCGHNRGLSL